MFRMSHAEIARFSGHGVAERTNFQLCIRPPLNHVVIHIFKLIVWRGNYLAVEVRFVYFVQ